MKTNEGDASLFILFTIKSKEVKRIRVFILRVLFITRFVQITVVWAQRGKVQ